MSISAFGIDHGEFSKRDRDTKRGLKTGAAIGAGVGGAAGIGASHVVSENMPRLFDSTRKAKHAKLLRETLHPGRFGSVALPVAGAAALGGAALGGGAGAAIGRKKKIG